MIPMESINISANLFFLAGFSSCINGGDLPDKQVPEYRGPSLPEKPPQVAVLAGGCFWGVDAVYKHVLGVLEVKSGYAGGSEKTADYESVCTGRTGHAESVQITYNPDLISFSTLLKIFFTVAHDPTELNRQGPDTGTQYRSAIFATTPSQKQMAEAYIDQINREGVFLKPIATQVTDLERFYPAEDYHQNFLELHLSNPYIAIHDLPKLNHLRKRFPDLYR
ncbi:MAG: peptide-methionine (S)-S-oxide reductase MsrA [Leptospirales bacterium]